MSDALGSLLIGEEIEAKADDGSLRERFPLNDKVVSVSYAGEDSDRVRLRKVIAEVKEQSLTISGAEPSQYLPDAQVAISGAFDQYGYLKSGRPIIKLSELLSDGQRETVQAALLTQGFPALVTESGEIRVMAFHLADKPELVEWYELGFVSDIEGVDIDIAREWVRTDPAFSEQRTFTAWQASSYSLDIAKQWVRLGRLSSPDTAGPWIDAGVLPSEAEAWSKVRPVFSSYQIAEPWRNNMPPEEAAVWLSACNSNSYRPDVSQVYKLKADGVTLDFLKEALTAGIEERYMPRVANLVVGGMSPSEALSWGSLGGDFISWYMRGWISAGVDPHKAKEWFALTRELPNLSGRDMMAGHVASWINAGKTTEEARAWIEASPVFWNYQSVEGWVQAGETPETIEQWLRLAEEVGEPRLASHKRLQEWWKLGEPFTTPESIKRMIQAGIKPEQAKALLNEIA